MKRISVCLAAAVAAVFGLNVGAQPPDDQNGDRPRAERRDGDQPNGDRPEGDREGRRGPRGEGRGPGGGFGGGFGGFRMPPNPVVAALDADEDGELSEAEINNAVKALKALDKNNDGKLAGDEIRPQFGPGGPGGFGGGGFGGGDPAQFVDRMIERSDANKDGKLAEDELPEFMRQGFADMDTNKDGFADKAEIEASFQRMRERFGQGRGPGGPGGDRPRERPPTRDRNGDRPEGDKPPGDAPGVSADDL